MFIIFKGLPYNSCIVLCEGAYSLLTEAALGNRLVSDSNADILLSVVLYRSSSSTRLVDTLIEFLNSRVGDLYST